MLQIEPSYTTNFKSTKASNPVQPMKKSDEKKTGMLITSFAVLAALGIAGIGIRKNMTKSYEEALKKAGVQIKNNTAILTKTGEKYTGKIKCHTQFNKKQTVEFVDGKITEKLSYDLMGKELEGSFYKDDKCVLQIWRCSGQEKNSQGFMYRKDNEAISKPEHFVKTKNGFDWARNFLNQQSK